MCNLRHNSSSSLYGYVLMIFLSLLFVSPVFAVDLIVNGENVSAPGGQYDQIVVINDGTLTINSNVECDLLTVDHGTLVIYGNLICHDSMSLLVNPKVSMTVYGESNLVNQATIQDGANLNLLGLWVFNDLRVEGKISTIPYSGTINGSGYTVLDCDSIYVSPTGHISADIAGNDPRGAGGGYGSSGGGGYGGIGGRGFWDATRKGPSFGEFYTYEIFMGGKGGNNGGGSLHIIAKTFANIEGKVTSNGGSDGNNGGGSGGGIMLTLNRALLTGIFEANGGSPTNSFYYGGGAGGRIKVFYYKALNFDDVNFAIFSALGGSGSRNGEDGTIYFDSIPDIPESVLPVDNAIVKDVNPTFTFTIADSSLKYDGREESLLCTIELSLDNFNTIFRTYNQKDDISGWSSYAYQNGNVVQFTPDDLLGTNSTTEIKWRVRVQDRSIFSEYSIPRNITLVDTTADVEESSPLAFKLDQNHPNPFNPQTIIAFTIPLGYDGQQIELSIYNILGQNVITLCKGYLFAGNYQEMWDGRNSFGQQVTSGIYIYELKIGNSLAKTRKMILTK